MIEQTILLPIISLIFGYLVGSLFISYPWGLLKGIDITKSGTGQLGGSNAGRILGWYALPICGLFDIFKSFMYLFTIDYSYHTFFSPFQALDLELALILGGVGLVLGHVYSIYLKFGTKKWQGGKGAAPYGGILLFISIFGFIVTYVVLFGILQGMKKLLKTKLTLYDNFMTNAIQLLASPFVIYFFVPEIWITLWLVILIIVLLIIERKKVFSIFGFDN